MSRHARRVGSARFCSDLVYNLLLVLYSITTDSLKHWFLWFFYGFYITIKHDDGNNKTNILLTGWLTDCIELLMDYGDFSEPEGYHTLGILALLSKCKLCEFNSFLEMFKWFISRS